MQQLPNEMGAQVGEALRDAELAHQRATALIRSPEGKRAEQLEDALNELQDAGYRARRAFRVDAVR